MTAANQPRPKGWHVNTSLVIRARGGDRDAFSAIVAESIGQLSAVARLILRDPQAAEDAVQDALVRAWRDLHGLRDPDRFGPWLHRVLVNSCYRHARGERRRQVREIQLQGDVGPMVTDVQWAVSNNDQLERGLQRLSVDQRALLVLAYYVDLPLADVAAILRIPVGTAKSRLHRTLRALRAEIDAIERDSALVMERFA